LSLQALISRPFELLLEMERRAKASATARAGSAAESEEWIGIAFRLGGERFVTARTGVREVLPLPDHLTRVPGAKPWLRGIANVRGQLLTIVDLKGFLGAGRTQADRQARILMLASREVPTAVIVDEVLGFRRFSTDDYAKDAPPTVIRAEHYLEGCYRRDAESWPLFDLLKLIEDEQFLRGGEQVAV
jgi:twitching motility protein PilI